MSSKLIVEICKINEIVKHPNADRLRIATVKGWNCIIGLDDYNVGDQVIYFPPDSIIPEDIITIFNLTYLNKGGRVKSTKLRGVLSQGLVLPLSVLDKSKKGQILRSQIDGEIVSRGNSYKYVGTGVAEMLGVTKYEPPVASYSQFHGRRPTKKKQNPLFDKYTGIENYKNYPWRFKDGEEVVMTEKIHGTNFRAGRLKRYNNNLLGRIKSWLFGEYEFIYGSHNVQLTGRLKRGTFYGEDVYGQIAKKYDLANKIPKDVIIYGEIYGCKIQDLAYGMKDIDLMVFDIKLRGKYLSYYEVVVFCNGYKLPMVPLLYEGPFSKEKLKEHTNGNSVLCEKQIKEGCVVKPVEEVMDTRLGRKILKSKSESYDLRKGGTEYN